MKKCYLLFFLSAICVCISAQMKQEIKIDFSEQVYVESKNYKPEFNLADSKDSTEQCEWSLDRGIFIHPPLPNYPGGEEAMYRFISSNLQYPEECLKDSLEGRVIIRLLIDKDGQIMCAKALRSFHPAAESEAIRVIMAMPDWVPPQGEYRDRSEFTLPIVFKLKKDKKGGLSK